MSEERILNVLGQVDDRYILEAAPGRAPRKNRARIKWASLAACLCLVLALLGIVYRYHQPYQLVRRDGSYYIILNPDRHKTPLMENQWGSGLVVVRGIVFDSISEMILDIRTGSFTDEEMDTLDTFTKDENGRIEIPDLSNLYEPVYPASFDQYTVSWLGTSYSFDVADLESSERAQLSLISPDFYNMTVDILQNYERNAGVELTEKSYESDRNATAYYHTAITGLRLKTLVYPITNGDHTFYVKERYYIDSSSDIPEHIYVYGSNGNQHFRVYIENLTERPSVEWLSQFGLKEYDETSAS